MIGAASAAVAGAVELPTMFIVGRFLPGETIGIWQRTACLPITTAIVMTPARVTRKLSIQMVMPAKTTGPPPRLSDVWFDD